MILSSDVLTSIAQELSRSKEAQRAKKLVFYVSQRYWEGDINVINSSSWEDLLQNLYENNPTRDDLKALLYQAVNTLNRKEVYLKIAKYIFKRMSSLYDDAGMPLESSNTDTNQSDYELIDTIIDNIEYHEESPRIKKLIFAACKQYWENDIEVINRYDMRQILMELRHLYPNTKRLRKALDNVVATINRQNFYSFIADTIVGELTYLYKYEPDVENEDVESEDEEEETRLILGSKVSSKQATSAQQVAPQHKATVVVENVASASQSQTNPVATNNNNMPEGQIIPWLKVDNLFDLKQEIMQYTNPLRAKIMLFYAIYQINPSEQNWSIVRTCTLDDLLVRMFQHYGQNIQQIESHLTEIAHSRIEGLEPEDNLQAVSAIVESIKRFYKKR